jgi:hypothetical protein
MRFPWSAERSLSYRLQELQRDLARGCHELWLDGARRIVEKENIDGEALLWASWRLRQHSAKRKLLFVLSDGAPVDGIGIGFNIARYYGPDSVTFDEGRVEAGLLRAVTLAVCGKWAEAIGSAVEKDESAEALRQRRRARSKKS